MANRGSAGYWIAIAFLFAVAATFSALWFMRETEILSLRETLRGADVAELDSTWKNANVRRQQEELVNKDRQIEALKAQIGALDAERRDLASSRDNELARSKRLTDQVRRLEANIQTLMGEKRTLEADVAKWRRYQDTKASQEVQKFKEEYEQAQVRLERVTRELKRAEANTEKLRDTFSDQLEQKERVIASLREINTKWQKETGREETIKTEQYDGRLIAVDTTNKFVVMNIGRAHHARRGMRFDVIRWRLNKWDYMGSVEITEVKETTSNGVILDAIVPAKVCPVTGYVARDPEEIYSPYAATGANQDRAVELVRTNDEERASMQPLDPILEGDYITNPFYSKDRKLKFVLAGDPVQYSANELSEIIKRYGGEVQREIDVDTDFLVLGRIPDESRVAESVEAKARRQATIDTRDKATQYGIPIMREVELFSIMRN